MKDYVEIGHVTKCDALMYQSKSKTAHPLPGHLTRVELRTAGNLTQNEACPVGHWTSCRNACQRSETKGLRNSLIQHVSHVHRLLLLLIPCGFFVVVVL